MAEHETILAAVQYQAASSYMGSAIRKAQWVYDPLTKRLRCISRKGKK